ITDTTGRLLIDPWSNAGQPSVGQIGGRLVASCHACRHAGRTLTTDLDLTRLCALAAALAFLAVTSDGDHPRRTELRVQAQADAIDRATRELIAGEGHEDSHRRRQRLELRAQLVRAIQHDRG
ncbi:MAG: hypothetical protein VB036_18740, partial [Propionicimonas sp.]|nr:hypothetical protein [Propionicimonas sp.]